MIEELALFPLNTVLYPGTSIALHIFEERYRQMIGQCLEQQRPFGIVLIRNGSEVDPNDPYIRQLRDKAGLTAPTTNEVTSATIGTSAQIVDSHRFEDGRYYLMIQGVQRFRLQSFITRTPYQIAQVEFLPEETPRELPTLAAEVRRLYQRFWLSAKETLGQTVEGEPLPDEPIALGYALAHQLRVDSSTKQRWLEADPATRLRELIEMLANELKLLPGARPSKGGSWSQN